MEFENVHLPSHQSLPCVGFGSSSNRNLNPHTFCMRNPKMTYYSLSKTHVLVGSLAPLSTSHSIWGAFKCCENLQILWNEKEAFDFGQKTTKMKFMLKFWRHQIWCSQKVDKGFATIAWPKSNTFASILPKLGVLTLLNRSFKFIYCQKWGETPYQNMRFERL